MWRQLFEVDPLVCPHGTGPMRIVAFITQAAVNDQILTHRRTRAAAGAAGARTGARSPPSTGASVARDPSRPRRPPTASPAPLPAP